MKVAIKVKPGSKKGPIVQPSLINDELLVFVREPAVDGKANRAIIKLLADYYEVAKSKVRIVSGLKSRTKVVEIITKDNND
jgi:hypothetical protein